MFGFDSKYAMFDITPVENQFILEYLPAAKGDYVKVYLYGLMRCYHPEDDMNLDRMSHELNMTVDEVTAAFGYWERRRLVHRISDNPPKWQYVNIKQLNVTEEPDPEPEYTEFSNALYQAFDKVRRLHGSELSTCFEWREELKLPTEVIIMLLNHMVSVKGKNFKITDADRIAVQMASEDVRTVEAAEDFFSRDEQTVTGVKKILKKMGKRYLPSEAQISMYRKWSTEWGFSNEAIEAALELTAKGDPSMGYLDGILNSLRQENAMTPDRIRRSSRKAEGFREILRELGRGDVSARNLQIYDQMLNLYPQGIILIAARECGQNGKDIGDTLKLLQAWKEKGLESQREIEDYVKNFHDQTVLIRKLKNMWGTDTSRISKTDRSLFSKWKNEFGFSAEAIIAAASYAAEAKQPMIYLDTILSDYRKKGISTPEQIVQEHERYRTGNRGKTQKVPPGLNFPQRSYQDVQEEMMQDLEKEVQAFMKENGGESDA